MNIPSFIDLYKKLISISSISSYNPRLDQSNEQIINIIADWLQSLSFKVEIKSISNKLNNLKKKKFNLIAKKGNGNGGLLLSGHTDTVTCDYNKWKNNPFILTQNNNKLYGLGTSDMKGFFAFVINAIKNTKNTLFKKPLYILATADEETSMIGIRDFIYNNKIKPDLAIIGEPTELKPIYSHKSNITKIIKIKGDSGHASNPVNKINAIDLMYKSISCLYKIKRKLKNFYYDKNFLIPYSTMNIGQVNGGYAVNKICEDCILYIDFRLLPKISIKDLNYIIEKEFFKINTIYPKRINISDLFYPIPGFNNKLRNNSIINLEKIIGLPNKGVNYCTEAPFIQKLCPTIIFGPGSIKQAHKPDEFLDMNFIKPTKFIIKKIIYDFCIN